MSRRQRIPAAGPLPAGHCDTGSDGKDHHTLARPGPAPRILGAPPPTSPAPAAGIPTGQLSSRTRGQAAPRSGRLRCPGAHGQEMLGFPERLKALARPLGGLLKTAEGRGHPNPGRVRLLFARLRPPLAPSSARARPVRRHRHTPLGRARRHSPSFGYARCHSASLGSARCQSASLGSARRHSVSVGVTRIRSGSLGVSRYYSAALGIARAARPRPAQLPRPAVCEIFASVEKGPF